MEDAVIVSAVRTPVGTFGGAYVDIPATRLGSIAVEEALRRAGIDTVDEVLMGNVLQAGLGQNTARQSAIGAGLRGACPCDDHQQGVRQRAQDGRARSAGDSRRRRGVPRSPAAWRTCRARRT